MMHPEILIVIVFVLLTTYGVLRRNRIFFNLGYFLYGLSVFVAEINQYLDIQSFSHLLFAILFLIQAILSVPNKLPYDGGKLAKSAAIKIFSCLALINLIGVLVPYTSPAPTVTYYLHSVMAIYPVVAMFLVLTNKIPVTEE
ncbi:MAG: hypothetical protein ACPG7X_00725 [Flavobacteriaceae bacterium]